MKPIYPLGIRIQRPDPVRHHPAAKAIAPRIPRELLGLRVGLLVADVRQVFGVGRYTAELAVKFARAA